MGKSSKSIRLALIGTALLLPACAADEDEEDQNPNQVAGGGQDIPQVRVRLGEVRIQPERLPVAGDRRLRQPSVGKGESQEAVALGHVRAKLDGLPQAGDRLVQPPLLPQGDSQVGVRAGQAGLQADGPPVAALRLGRLPPIHQEIAQEEVRLGETRVFPRGLLGFIGRKREA